MANNIIRRTWKQGGMVNIEDLRGSAFQAESGGHTFLISGVDIDGNPLALSGTPAGVLLRADGQDVTLTCSVSDGVVSATLPANAYVVPGRVGITVFLTSEGQKTAIYAAVGSVATTSSGTVAPPAGSDVVDLVNAISTAVATIPASYTDLMAAVAPTYSSSALYAVGSYAWYDGKLYRCTTAITSGETWTSAHWTLANLGSDVSDLKSALNDGTTFNAITNYPFAISSSDGKWVTGNLACVGIPCTGAGTLVAQTMTGLQTNMAFLKTFNPVTGNTPDLCDGQTGRIIIPTTKTTYNIPSDCNYIYIMTMNAGNDYTPAVFEIDGMDYVKNIVYNIGHNIAKTKENEKNITNNTSDISNIKSVIAEQYKEINVPYTVTEGYYYNARGNISSPTSGFVLVDMDITDVVAVKIYGYQANSMAGLFFVDANGNAIPDKNGDIYHIPTGSGYNTIELDKPAGAVTAKTSFSVSSDRTYHVNGFTYVFGESIEMPSFANVLMIPIFGQSLSVGAAATPPISTTPKYADGIMFNGGVVAAQKAASFFQSFQPLSETNVETPASGCADKIAEQIQRDDGLSVLSTYWDKHKVLFVSCGAGSKTIADLTTDYYAGLQNAIQGAKNICDADGLTLNIPCWIWIQGETDQKEDPANSKAATDKATYKTALTTLQGNLNTYAKSVTGQSNDIVCICYQSAAQNIVSATRTPSYTNTAVMGVPTAQMELVRDNGSFVASSPVYVMDHSASEPIHLSNVGSKMLGLYCGIAAKAVMFGEAAPTGLVPASYSISGTTLTLTYNVPVPPIRIDTEWVKEVAHYGYTLLDSNNTDIITGVSVFDNTVTITCSASPLNAMLFYGFNGSQWRDGRFDGSRGNICDSAKFVFDGEIGGKRYTLGNYAYSFVKLLDSESGTI